MEHKTYLELLAENDEDARREFPPNAKEFLTASFVEYEHDVGGEDNHPDELPDQQDFQKQHGSHQEAAQGPEPPKDIHRTTTGVRYDKDTQIHVVSIDSRFRANLADTPSNFLVKMTTPIKNAISVRVSSLEIPNTWYTFSEIKGNVSFVVNIQPSAGILGLISGRLVITEGNYSVNTLYANDILIELFNQLAFTFPNNSFAVYFNPISGKLNVSCFTKQSPYKDPATGAVGYTYFNQPKPVDTTHPKGTAGYELPMSFSFNFSDSIFSNRTDNWGLGYNLGYRIKETEYATSHMGTAIVDVIDANYIFLSLHPDWNIVEHTQPETAQTVAFAKVIVDVAKNDIVYENGANTVTKVYTLKQPTNITAFNIAIFDEYERYVQLEGGSVSLTLEVTEVLHASLYETMRG